VPAVRPPAASPRIESLLRRAEFLRARSKGRRFAAPGMVVQSFRREDADGPIRLGLTVSRKVGGAVVRNRARRRLRAAAMQVLPALAEAGRDLVLIGRAATLERPFAALVGDLETALARTGARKERRS